MTFVAKFKKRFYFVAARYFRFFANFALKRWHPRIIAVTGSDGKTTTTTVIAEMLRAAGRRVFLGGNIGTPLLDRTGEMSADDLCVLELSSFQLMSMR